MRVNTRYINSTRGTFWRECEGKREKHSSSSDHGFVLIHCPSHTPLWTARRVKWMKIQIHERWWCRASCPRMSVDILGTNCDQCQSTVQCCFTATETVRLIRTESPGRPPRLSHSSRALTWKVPDLEFIYNLVFTRMPGESYRRRLGSLLLYLCYVFRVLINSLVC